MDQDEIQVTIHLPTTLTSTFKISSGGELQIGADVAQKIEDFASNNQVTELSFSLDSYLMVNDLEDKESNSLNIRETTRLALIAARLGQGLFRRNLEQRYGHSCAITGIS